jgi:hypothetical protein
MRAMWAKMMLAYIAPKNPDTDQRTVECDKCGYGETTLVKFR